MSRFKLGLQLYSVREDMEKDMDATLKKVSEMGYECVEFAGYFGRTADEVKAMCEKYGLEPISVHQKHNVFLEDSENSVKFLKDLGVKYCAIPWISPDDWENKYDSLIDEIKKTGRLLKENGIQLMYHNHDFELCVKHNGDYVLNTIYKDVDRELLLPEFDVCWITYGGADPVEYIKEFKDCEKILHLKDFECKKLGAGPVYDLIDEKGRGGAARDKESDGFEFRATGCGRVDICEYVRRS